MNEVDPLVHSGPFWDEMSLITWHSFRCPSEVGDDADMSQACVLTNVMTAGYRLFSGRFAGLCCNMPSSFLTHIFWIFRSVQKMVALPTIIRNPLDLESVITMFKTFIWFHLNLPFPGFVAGLERLPMRPSNYQAWRAGVEAEVWSFDVILCTSLSCGVFAIYVEFLLKLVWYFLWFLSITGKYELYNRTIMICNSCILRTYEGPNLIRYNPWYNTRSPVPFLLIPTPSPLRQGNQKSTHGLYR